MALVGDLVEKLPCKRVGVTGQTLLDDAAIPGRIRVPTVPVPEGRKALAAAVRADPPPPEREAVWRHPLAAWVEETFGLATEDGRLVRRTPLAFEQGVQSLVEATGLESGPCRARLRAVLEAGNTAEMPTGEPVFAFRLHQFLASGGSVYATLQESSMRTLLTEGQVYAPNGGEGEPKPLYPLAFCRECGQESAGQAIAPAQLSARTQISA